MAQASEIHARAHEISRRLNVRGAPKRRIASPPKFVRMHVYFTHPTIAIAKIRDYLQSNILFLFLIYIYIYKISYLGGFQATY